MVTARLVLYAMLAAAIAAFGAWALSRAYQSGRESLRPRLMALEASITAANLVAKERALEAQRVVDGLRIDLDTALMEQKVITVEVLREVQTVARSDRACLSADVGRVLGNAIAAANRRLAQGSRSALVADTGAGSGPVDELAVAEWSARVIDAYSTLRQRHQTLAGVVETIPCVKIDEEK